MQQKGSKKLHTDLYSPPQTKQLLPLTNQQQEANSDNTWLQTVTETELNRQQKSKIYKQHNTNRKLKNRRKNPLRGRNRKLQKDTQ